MSFLLSNRGISAVLGIILLSCPALAQEGKKAEFTIRLATVAPADTPWHKVLLDIKKSVADKTKGRVNLLLFMGGQLGGEVETLKGCQMGAIEAWGGSTGALETLIPEFGMFDLPFLWKSDDELYYIIDNVLTKPFFDKLEKIGLKGASWTENGWRNIGTRTKAVRLPDDLKGLKIRSQESRVHLAFWKALGAIPIPVPIPDVLSALQTGLVDGADSSIIIMSASGWLDTVKYLTISRHIYQPAVVAFNKEYFNKLPRQTRSILLEEFKKSQALFRKGLKEVEPELLKEYMAKGIEVYELTPGERKEFEDKVRIVQDEFRELFGDFLGMTYKAQAKHRGKTRKN